MDKLEPTPNIISSAKHVGAQKIVVLIGTTLPFTTMQDGHILNRESLNFM